MAEWSSGYVSDLPDSAFLFIEAGGTRDEDGKTKPRSLRHFPYRDKNGDVDVAHVRNAIARIPQSNAEGLTADKKSKLQDKARRLLEQANEESKGMEKRQMVEALAKVEGLLSKMVGAQRIIKMSPEQFVAHAMSELEKAASESFAVSSARLSLLHKSVLFSSEVIENTEAEDIKVPVFVAEQTTLAEQENNVMTPAAAMGLNPSAGTVFESGFVAKLEALLSKLGDMEEGEDAQGKAPPTPEGKKKSETDTMEGEEESKRKAAKKSLGADADEWPSDMNTPEFLTDNKIAKSEWGDD